jgi:hypothetical protein
VAEISVHFARRIHIGRKSLSVLYNKKKKFKKKGFWIDYNYLPPSSQTNSYFEDLLW